MKTMKLFKCTPEPTLLCYLSSGRYDESRRCQRHARYEHGDGRIDFNVSTSFLSHNEMV